MVGGRLQQACPATSAGTGEMRHTARECGRLHDSRIRESSLALATRGRRQRQYVGHAARQVFHCRALSPRTGSRSPVVRPVPPDTGRATGFHGARHHVPAKVAARHGAT